MKHVKYPKPAVGDDVLVQFADSRVADCVGAEESSSVDALPYRMLYLVGGWGGAERVDLTELFANHLASMGLDIDWVIFSPRPGPAWCKERWRGTSAYVVGRSRFSGAKGAVVNKLIEMSADLLTFWLILSGKYDLVQVRDKFVVGVLGLLAARLRRAKFTYWLSYPFAECRILDAKEGRARFPLFSRVGGAIASWLLYRIIMPNSDHVFVQSDRMLQDVAAQGVPERLMSAVPMAVSEALLDRQRLVVESQSVLYLGTLSRVRRLEVLLDAMLIVHEHYPNARLAFVGEGDSPEDRSHLERETRARGLEEWVEFTGMLPMAQAHDRVQRAAACVSPFFPTPVLLSTSPTKLIEYMALGRPVVANDHPEQTRIISESRAGFCVPWSAKDFAGGICALFAAPDEAEIMGARGRSYVRRNRTYSLVAQRVSEDYQCIMGAQGLVRPISGRASQIEGASSE